MDAIQRLVEEGSSCCDFSNIIVGPLGPAVISASTPPATPLASDERLNQRQMEAVESSSTALSLIWGPPGVHSLCFSTK
jgi:hypothetical protein